MKPTRTLNDGTRIYGLRLELHFTEDDYKKLRALFPKGVTVKHAVVQALQYLFAHEDQNLPRKLHILTEAFHAQTKGMYDSANEWQPKEAPVVTKRNINEAARSTLQQMVQQDPGVVLRELARMLGSKSKEEQ